VRNGRNLPKTTRIINIAKQLNGEANNVRVAERRGVGSSWKNGITVRKHTKFNAINRTKVQINI
jgi:hypothetical protein